MPGLFTADSAPSVVARPTVPPELVRLLPAASFSWTVMTEVPPPAAMGEVAADIVEVASEAVPATTVNDGLPLLMGAPPMVPEIVALPAATAV